jgi:3-oxo-5alpha-steroid 4-dehydrogenase
LAKKCRVNAAALEQTVAEYNALATARRSDPLGKLPDLMRPLGRGPFYAVNLCISNKYAPAQAFTLGGLIVDEETGAVKRADGTIVEGLYAAGRAAVGVCSNGYISGLSIADTVFSGRRAGRVAARPPA